MLWNLQFARKYERIKMATTLDIGKLVVVKASGEDGGAMDVSASTEMLIGRHVETAS